MKPVMFCGKSLFSHIVKAVIIAFLVFSINPLEAARPNSKLGTTQDRAKVPSSTTNPPTYIPGPGNGGGHK